MRKGRLVFFPKEAEVTIQREIQELLPGWAKPRPALHPTACVATRTWKHETHNSRTLTLTRTRVSGLPAAPGKRGDSSLQDPCRSRQGAHALPGGPVDSTAVTLGGGWTAGNDANGGQAAMCVPPRRTRLSAFTEK